MKRTTTLRRKYDGATSFCIGCDSPLKLNAQTQWVSNSQTYIKTNQRIRYIPQEEHYLCPNSPPLEFQMDSEIEPSTTMSETANVITGSGTLGTTVTNVTDAVVKVSDKAAHAEIGRPLKSNADDMTDQSIKFYLGKPVRYIAGILQSTDSASTFVSFDVMTPLYTNAVFLNKIQGVFSFRATAVFTIQINATRFQQGRYIFYHLPMGGANTISNQSAQWKLMHTYSRANITTLPRVEFDINKDTEAQLRVPFVSWMTAMPTPNDTATTPTIGSPGIVGLRPYKALVAGAGSVATADYTIWVHYENVELFSNTNTQCADLEFQMGFADKEETSRGPVSSGLQMVSDGARLASVPLNSLLDGIGWVTDVAAGFAHTLGWSSPRIATAPARFVQNFSVNNANADGLRNIQQVSLSEHNKVDPCPGFAGSGIDELTLDYIKGIYGFYKELSITTSTAKNTVIFSENVAPQAYVDYNNSDGAVQTYNYCPVGFLSAMFGQYRGGIVYKFKFVKTEFHTGRLLVVVNPIDFNRSTSGVTPTIAQTDYLQKTIIDLRECNEFEVEVPFISNTSWKNTGSYAAANSPRGQGEIFARINVYLLNEIRAPPTVPTTINMLVEVKGATDCEFQIPTYNNLCPGVPTAISNQCSDLEFQSGETSTGIIPTGAIGSTNSSADWLSNAAACSGEVVTSLRQLLKRPGFLGYNASGGSIYTRIIPTGWQPTFSNGTTYTVVGNSDMTTVLSSMFCLRRGGTRIMPVADSLATTQFTNAVYLPTPSDVTAEKVISFTGTYPFSNSLRTMPNGANWGLQRNDWGTIYEFPSYATTHAQPTIGHLYDTFTDISFSLYGNSSGQALIYALGGGTQPTIPWYRMGADDTNYGGFAGMPVFFNTGFPPT